MPKDNNYTLEQIKKNLLQFQKKIKDKNMNENFWIIADRADFKPLKKVKKISKKESKNTSKKDSKKDSKNTSKKDSKKTSKKDSKKTSKKDSKKTSKKDSNKTSKKDSKKDKNLIIHSIKELKENFLEGKEEYYKDKKFANIKVTIDNNILNSLDNIREYKNIIDTNLLIVQITVFKVSPTGYLNFGDKTELKVKYTSEDFRKFHFKLKNLEVLMRLVTDSVIKINTNNGITYKKLLEKINKNK